MSREIELKFMIHNLEKFMVCLKNESISLESGICQSDTIFFRKGKSFLDLAAGEPVIRIRQEQDKITTTIKKYVSGIIEREEIECTISSADEFKKYLLLLDIVPVVSVYKIRQKGKYKGVNITVDHVEGLGDFTEFEIVSENSDKETVEKLYGIAEQLGFRREDRVTMPYDEMIFKKQKLKNINGGQVK